jgi:hypothetical protein
MDLRLVTALTLLVAVVAGCTGSTPAASPGADDAVLPQAVSGGNGGGGGSVKNTAPTVTAFAADRTAGQNDGSFAVVFSGAVFDANTESQIDSLSIASTGAGALGSSHSAASSERQATTEPTSFGADGWKVWTGGTKNDGTLEWKYRQAFPIFTGAGNYTFRLTVTDQPGGSGVSSNVTIVLQRFSLISVGGAPVDATGAPLPGQNWGQWSAEAGGENVASTNHLKLVNDGDSPDARVVLDFTEAAYRGAADANFTIALDGNVQFAWFEDTTPATTAPSEKPFSFGATSGNGAVTVAFTGKGNVVYVAYRLVKLPAVLPVQSYGATFTVTEL